MATVNNTNGGVTYGSMASTADATDPVVIQLDQAAQLSRIADSLDTIIDMIKKDQEESKKRWAEKDE